MYFQIRCYPILVQIYLTMFSINHSTKLDLITFKTSIYLEKMLLIEILQLPLFSRNIHSNMYVLHTLHKTVNSRLPHEHNNMHLNRNNGDFFDKLYMKLILHFRAVHNVF